MVKNYASPGYVLRISSVPDHKVYTVLLVTWVKATNQTTVFVIVNMADEEAQLIVNANQDGDYRLLAVPKLNESRRYLTKGCLMMSTRLWRKNIERGERKSHRKCNFFRLNESQTYIKILASGQYF